MKAGRAWPIEYQRRILPQQWPPMMRVGDCCQIQCWTLLFRRPPPHPVFPAAVMKGWVGSESGVIHTSNGASPGRRGHGMTRPGSGSNHSQAHLLQLTNPYEPYISRRRSPPRARLAWCWRLSSLLMTPSLSSVGLGGFLIRMRPTSLQSF